MDITLDVFGFTNSGSKVKIGEISKRLYPIGGKVFYVDINSTGASYSFYDSNGDLITVDDTDISTFTNASYYTVSGTPSTDKYYVYESTTGVVSGKYWGYYGITTDIKGRGIGGGKTSTDSILQITDTSQYASDSIWTHIKGMRTNETNGCDDWFVGTEEEYTALKQVSSSLLSNAVWCCFENNDQAVYINRFTSGFTSKANTQSLIPLRSF